MSQNFSDFTEGTLQAALDTTTTTGVTAKIKQINGDFPTWPTGAHQIMIVQKTRTQTKVEKLNVASGTSQVAATGIVTLGTLTRKISLTDGTDITGTGTAQSFTQGADVFIAWTTTDAEQTAKKDEANTFSANQLISGTNELRFTDSATAIFDDGTNLSFKDSVNSTITLTTIAAASGADQKVGVDTGATADFIGAASSDGVLRTDSSLDYTDGGDFVTLGIAAPVSIANGGTGATSLTDNGVVTVNGTVLTTVAPGTAGNVLKSDGTDWTSGATGQYQGKIWISITDMFISTSAAVSAQGLNSGASAAVSQFDGAGANEISLAQFQLPDDYDGGTITVQYWIGGGTGGPTVWGSRAVAFSDSDAGAAFGSQQLVTFTITAQDYHITTATPAITIANTPAAGDFITLEIARPSANAGDTVAADVGLMGIIINYTIA